MHHATGLVGGLLCCASTCLAQSFLVKNIGTTPETADSALTWLPSLEDWGAIGNRLFFSANDGVHGGALWTTDGTEKGTRLVRDFPPGLGGYGSFEGRAVGSLYFFNAQDGSHGSELWVSDGTEQGTRLVIDLEPGAGFGQPQYFAELNGELYFRPLSSPYGSELFRSDGTLQGTRVVRDIVPGPGSSSGGNASRPVRVGNQLLFGASTPELGLELWRTDGTEAGTVLVRDLAPGPNSSQLWQLTPFNDLLVFAAVDPGSTVERLYRSDGTSSGTFVLLIPGNLQYPERICATPIGVFCIARTPAGLRTLAFTDGSVAGTRNLGAVSDCYAAPDTMGALPHGVVLPLSDPTRGCELWFSDGTSGGTRVVLDIATGTPGSIPKNFISLPSQGLVFFIARASAASGDELWRTDGTPEGTFPITSFAPASPLSLSSLRAAADVLYFAADDGQHGTELWITDGTIAGTRLVKDIRLPRKDGSSDPDSFIRAGNSVYFAAFTPATGFELWRTDARPSSTATFLVKDINPGTAEGIRGMREIGRGGAAAFGDRLIFSANDGVAGSEPWITDGSSDGTRRIADLNPNAANSSPAFFTALDDCVIFTAAPAPNANPAVFRTDGTVAGTTRLTSICTVPQCISQPLGLARVGDHVIFRYTDSIHGTELWTTRGAPDGSDTSVIDLIQGPFSGVPSAPAVIGNLAVFSANTDTMGRELWVTGGTAETTSLLADLAPGAPSSQISGLTAAGSHAFFVADTGNGRGAELWVTDGAAGGTHLVRDIVPGGGSPTVRSMVASGERLYFVADDHSGSGFELWTSDGTVDGTYMIADLIAGNDNVEEIGPTNLAPAADEQAVFSIPSAAHGYELWITDGTEAGTRRLSDINPGSGSSWPFQPYAFDQTVLFSAYEPMVGRELYGVQVGGNACPCDWDDSGLVNSVDFFEFARDFFLGDADYDHSGATNSDDFFAFLACFFAEPCI